MRDLSREVTVFLISSGENPNYAGCVRALESQTCKFTLDVIRDVSPLSLAFQEMLNRVKTPYYIECDEDMVLNKNAVEKMYCDIAGEMHDDKTAMHAYMLIDQHLGMPIYGVKIYKARVFRQYPYNLKHPSCEVEQLRRIEADGYTYKLLQDAVGSHSPLWTPALIFERYYNLMEKFKLFRYVWMESLPRSLAQKVQSNPTDLNLYAFAGALAGVYSDSTMESEKDSRRVNKSLGRLLPYLEQPHQCTLYLTSSCNFHCSFCYRQHAQIEPAPDMAPVLVDTIMGKFPDVKAFCVCGFGEPLLSPSLVPVLQKLKAAGKIVGVVTNGSLLLRRIPELCGWYKPDYISVSLNAHTREEHELVTGTRTWDEVVDGIRALVRSPIPAYVSSVVTRDNLKYLPELIRWVHSLGVKTLHLHNVLPHFDPGDNSGFWARALTREASGVIEGAKKHPESSIVKKWPTLVTPGRSRGACKFPFYSFAVNGNGNLSYCNSVLPCSAEYGNIRDFVVWNSPQAQAFREKFCSRELPHCGMCFRDWEFDGRME